ncbi:threonyl-tRNA synthetase-like protein, partial [Aureobasidium melanogenum]
QLPQQFNLEYRSAEAGEAKAKGEEVKAPVLEQKPTEAAPAAEGEKGEKSAASYRRELTPGCQRPVMIHRAIYGSFERFIAILTEHFAGKWPFWLSPRQILIVPVMPAVNDYVEELQALFRGKGMHADIDITGNTMQKKIRTGQLAQYNFIFVVGAQEKESRTVNIRNRDDPETQKLGELIPLDVAVQKMEALRDERKLKTEL